MRSVLKRLAGRLTEGYRGMSIQLVLSLSFTAVALAGILFLGASLLLRFSDSAQRMTQEATQRVLAQVNMNLDSYLRRMMRVSDTVYYRAIKKTDLTQRSLADAMGLLYEENRDAVVSIAVFNEGGGLEAAAPLSSARPRPSPTRHPGSGWPWRKWKTSTSPPPTSRSCLTTRTAAAAGWCPSAATSSSPGGATPSGAFCWWT